MIPSMWTRTIAALLLVSGAAVALPATVLVPVDLYELVSAAQTVVYGRVIGTHGVRSADRGTETLVTLSAVGYLKGQGGREVVFRVAGGEIGRYRTVVVGAPVFREGDEVICFLKGQAPEVPYLVGFSQGALRVHADAAGVRRVMAPPMRAAQPARVVRGEGYQRFVTLEDFAGQVRDAQALDARERAKTPQQAPRKTWQGGR
jgi:hypothetical protein